MYLLGPALFGIVMIVSELGLVIIKHSTCKDYKRKDGATLRIIWSSILSCCFIAYVLLFMKRPESALFSLSQTGWVTVSLLFSFGLVLRWWSILSLGRFFTVDVAIHQNHRLITSGVYGWVRHPSYTGLLINFFVFAMVFQNSVCFFLVFLPAVFTLMYRIKVEEKALEKAFGEEYRMYRKTTFRLFPGLY